MRRRLRIGRGPASHYAVTGEVIVEFSDGQSGGLISVRRDGDGRMVVDVYRTDADVYVLGPVAPDTVSSVSRQHYIDTGEYLPAGEEARPL